MQDSGIIYALRGRHDGGIILRCEKWLLVTLLVTLS